MKFEFQVYLFILDYTQPNIFLSMNLNFIVKLSFEVHLWWEATFVNMPEEYYEYLTKRSSNW